MLCHAPGHNFHIYSARDTYAVLGGLVVTGSMTNANFYSMVEIAFIFDGDYTKYGVVKVVQLFSGTAALSNRGGASPILQVSSPSTMSLGWSVRDSQLPRPPPKDFEMLYVSVITDVL